MILGRFGRELLTGPLIFLAKPVWQASDNLGTMVATQVSSLGQSRQELLVLNKNLREENNKLKTRLLAKQSLETDNIQLRSILGRSQNQAKPIVARVIFLPNFVPYNNLLLDIGKNNSTKTLKVGDFVVADGAVLVGRLAEIDATYSKARLISTETSLPVVIGSKNIPAIAVGSGAGNFTITLPKDTPVVIGDRVMAPLLNNYLIGSVGHVEKLVSRPTQIVLVRTPINIWQLKWLEIYDAKA
ncbi:MAG: rod shape-determining protein MreC [Candidatus Vogelbacteria bacterium]|nr:rod shape-determining protein MreC [Candidatus Vogelbacteria bacterium]